MLKDKDYPIRCVSTGEGTKYVEGLGFLSDEELVHVYSQSHLLVYPSKSDMFGLVILEALACNTPVITTSIESHKALNLPLIYANTPLEFFRRILSMFKLWKEGKYHEFASRLRAYVTKYGVNKVIPRIENMFKSVKQMN